MKNILFIDTHKGINIILFNSNEIINSAYIENIKFASVYLMDSVINVIGDNNVDKILVVNGPGSFTGTRLGVVIAKTLAYEKNIDINTVSVHKLANIITGYSKIIMYDNKGYYYCDYDNSDKIEYSSNNDDRDTYFNVDNFEFNNKIVYDYFCNLDSEVPEDVNPIYIKKLDVEK